ncbi:MAG: UMP kinase [Bacilli bacterium]
MKYKRIILKLSGEALKSSKDSTIIDADLLKNVARAIKLMHEKGVEVAIVIGAGNIFRGKLAETIGIEHSVADYMGMLGTIINSLALQSAIENTGLECRVMSSIEVKAVSEPYIRRRALSHLEKGIVTIFAGGTGNPYFTTDTTATLRAIEINADAILMAKNGVEGVYSSDPRIDSDAKLIKHLTYSELYERNLKVMDHTAVAMMLEQNIDIRVFSMTDTENFVKVINGEDIGTTVSRN